MIRSRVSMCVFLRDAGCVEKDADSDDSAAESKLFRMCHKGSRAQDQVEKEGRLGKSFLLEYDARGKGKTTGVGVFLS